MTVTISIPGSATKVEVFSTPGDYPEFETESGQRLAPGHYWWFLRSCGTPDSYPVGPFGSSRDAQDDAEVYSSAEPVQEDD